ncbi:MAG: Fe-S cluster assembly protein HesB [Candidatus Odinarchaeota archaeon]
MFTNESSVISRIRGFQEKIFDWWETNQPGKPWIPNKRAFPWRNYSLVKPYHVLVSEFMLQQTQASRVVNKYLAFIEKFPDIQTLARAPTSEVLSLWSGLGYNRRAIWLQEAARSIVQLGSFPRTPKELEKLKGIGSYTSRSILIFAFNEDIAAVDTNIRRILISEGFASETNTEKELLEIASDLVPDGRSRDWHNALMDYGALVKTATKTGIKPLSTQGTFEGSNRQYRGRVVKYLTEHKNASKNELAAECRIPSDKVGKVLESLISDNLVILQGDRYSLPAVRMAEKSRGGAFYSEEVKK